MNEPAWETLLPKFRGRLPGGGDLVRTDPGGSASAKIAVLGLHPSAIRAREVRVGKVRLLLPAAVEERSFEASLSGEELRKEVLAPLRIDDSQVYLIDSYPYYLASNSARGDGVKWSNIQEWRRQTGETDDVQERPDPNAMPRACRELPGNLKRLADQLARCHPTLLFTLGAEVAAFVRDSSLGEGQRGLYGPAERLKVFGETLEVVHLAHPGIFGSPLGARWRATHAAWCTGDGAALIAKHLART